MGKNPELTQGYFCHDATANSSLHLTTTAFTLTLREEVTSTSAGFHAGPPR